jgi:hypothetical protein
MEEFNFVPNVNKVERENTLKKMEIFKNSLLELEKMIDSVNESYDEYLSLFPHDKDGDFLKMTARFRKDLKIEREEIEMEITQEALSISKNSSAN